MLEKVEELRTACKNIAYCYFYPKIVSESERLKYCHNNNCPKGKIRQQVIFSLQEIVMENYQWL